MDDSRNVNLIKANLTDSRIAPDDNKAIAAVQAPGKENGCAGFGKPGMMICSVHNAGRDAINGITVIKLRFNTIADSEQRGWHTAVNCLRLSKSRKS